MSESPGTIWSPAYRLMWQPAGRRGSGYAAGRVPVLIPVSKIGLIVRYLTAEEVSG